MKTKKKLLSLVPSLVASNFKMDQELVFSQEIPKAYRHYFAQGARVGGGSPPPLPPDPESAAPESAWVHGAMHSSPPGPLMKVRSGASRGCAEGLQVAAYN